MEAQDLYGTSVRLSRDGLAYGEEFVPLDEMDEARPLSGNLWNPATNLFEVAVFRCHGPPLVVRNRHQNRRPTQESYNRCPTRTPGVTRPGRSGTAATAARARRSRDLGKARERCPIGASTPRGPAARTFMGGT
jgi:hypothetical protein